MTDHNTPFQPDPVFAERLQRNRVGLFTSGQKATVIIIALVTGVGLLCLSGMMINMIVALFQGIGMGSLLGWIFLSVFLLTYLYLGLTLYINVRMFLPDALSRRPVKQAQGRLKIKMAERERHELPFSYIVDDYSFAPYMVPGEVKMTAGQEYIVYYAAHSRMFLSIEPVQPDKANPQS